MTAVLSRKHEVVRQRLATAIRSGSYGDVQKLSGEHKLASSFGVSRGTIRKVLDRLAQEGLVNRVPGSGTYVNADNSSQIVINVPVAYPDKPLVKHFLGKMKEMCYRNTANVQMNTVPYKPTAYYGTIHIARELFTNPKPSGLFEVTMADLPWLVREGLCEDVTAAFSSWSQKDNIFDVVVKAITHSRRIYAFPFHCSLGGLSYHEKAFELAGLDPVDAVSSIDKFLSALGKIKSTGMFENTLFIGSSRYLLMYLLRLFYEDLHGRFLLHGNETIERSVGIEVLKITKKLRWELDVAIPFGSGGQSEIFRKKFHAGAIASTLLQLIPAIGKGVSFVPFAYGPDKKPFSLFNSYAWIINPHITQDAKQFLISFLQEYVHPDSEYEIDRKYIEEDETNERSTPFIESRRRVPYNPLFERHRSGLFKYAEMEVPYPCPAFDNMLIAVLRILQDKDASPESVYEFYSSIPMTISTFQNSIVADGVLNSG